MTKKPRRQRPQILARTQRMAAAVYGVSTKHLQELFGRGCPGKGAKGYDLLAMGQWFSRNSDRFQTRATVHDVEPGSRADLEIRQLRAETGLSEIKLGKEQRRFCIREDVERLATETFTTLRLLLSALPLKCAVCVPTESRAEVQQSVGETIATTLKTVRKALGRAVDEEDPPDLLDPFDLILRSLEALPAQIGAVVKSAKQRAAVERVGQKWIDKVKEDLAKWVEERSDASATRMAH